MILSAIITLIVTFLTMVFQLLPTVEELPWGTDAYLGQGVQYFKLLADFFPPFATLLTAFLLYVSFKLLMLVIKFFLGSRTPSHS